MPGAVVGNSSSDLLEAPTLGTPTVNIGTRQDGRLRASSVVDCEPTASAIEVAVNNVLQPQYRLTLAGLYNQYGLSGMCTRIVEVLEKMALDGLTMKVFHDLPPASGCG